MLLNVHGRKNIPRQCPIVTITETYEGVVSVDFLSDGQVTQIQFLVASVVLVL
jgi:hypothetical protein